MLDEILKDAAENLKKINDPYCRVMAAAAILPFLDNSTTCKNKSKKAKAEAVETAQAAEASVVDESAVEAINEAIKQEEAKAEAEAKVQAVVEPEEIIVPVPKADETPAETQRRITMYVKKYGDKKLGEVFNSNELMSIIEPEIVKVSAFQTKLHSVLDAHASEAIVEDLFHHYIKEAQPGIKEYDEITMDKFLLVYMPYQGRLDTVYSTDLAVMDKAIRELYGNMISKDDTSVQIGMINIDNAETLIDVINAVNKAA